MGRKTEPPLRGRKMEPLYKGRKMEPPKRGRNMEPPRGRRKMEPPRMGREPKTTNEEPIKREKEFKPAAKSKPTTDERNNTRNKRRREKRIMKRQQNKKEGSENLEKRITILYANANGIGDKAISIQSAAQMTEAHIIAITETKQIPPKIEGYAKWYSKERKDRQGGGVAITVKEELTNITTRCTEFDEEPQEVVWVELKTSNVNSVYICTYYGKQEKAPAEEVENEYSNLAIQVEYFRKKGEVILTGDFNAKLQIEKNGILQRQSPHGQILQDFIDFNQLHVASLNTQKGTWTRQNRNKPEEKSVIDYIIVTGKLEHQIQQTIIDEEGHLRIKGRKESDHNTIVMRTGIQAEETKRKVKRYKMNNIEGWSEYRKQIGIRLANQKPKDPENLTKIMVKTLKETVGEVTITVGKRRKDRESEEVKKAKEEKKKKKKEYEEAIRRKDNIDDKKRQYFQAEDKLRSKIEENIKEESKRKLEKMRDRFGIRTNEFWRHRANCEGKDQKDDYDTVTEEGRIIENPIEAKEYIADFYEKLYRGRESHPEYKEKSDEIEAWCKKKEEEISKTEEVQNITENEMNKAIKRLKRNKAMGPDRIPNEALIETGPDARKQIIQVFNQTNRAKSMPELWQEGELNRIYKGKGKKGKCSNERGITVSSNLGKLYERIINERIKTKVNMTWAQAGGRQGAATTDHILLMKEVIETSLKKKDTVYMVFLDVTKAFDKAWLSGILHVLYNCGLKDRHWLLAKNLNQNLKAKIKTKYGHTRTISISNSIRQGGVLSVILFGLLMDQICKEIPQDQAGIKIEGTDLQINSLLWVDDVILFENDPKKLQGMLDIVDHVAKTYHLEFGESKSKAMKIGKSKDRPTFKLGDMTLEYVEQYKYLGYLQNEKNTNNSHMKSLKGKIEAAYQKTLSLATNPTLKYVEMQAIWITVETCIIPIITYAGEVMDLKRKKDQKELNRMLENIIKRILKVPIGTPTEALYVETGMIPPTAMIEKNQTNMCTRLMKGDNPWMKKMVDPEKQSGWIQRIRQTEQRMEINRDGGTGNDSIKSQMEKKLKTKIKKEIEDKRNSQGNSKLKHLLEGKTEWEPMKCPAYMKALTRNQASLIFKARTRMIECKANFKKKYKNEISCRKCNQGEENQKHIFQECQEIHRTDETRIKEEEIFTEDPNRLANTAKKIEKILTALEPRGKNPRRPP